MGCFPLNFYSLISVELCFIMKEFLPSLVANVQLSFATALKYLSRIHFRLLFL